ncbi:uncharacterized protein LOC112342337 [Selaginella moellendorffii]|uniref:uncharacterized protein LOC112342337 n=1 Tax=Selaginella moellendorffii TaxID=88036 RepID=UPI000D1C5623|nr:uncharacterized protein LOC112342337 [Selaginella moellendorffii]|eukprot:XP_024519780.1 uncharacterized protein LOC112342337 [Selaginella moellendorffii]
MRLSLYPAAAFTFALDLLAFGLSVGSSSTSYHETMISSDHTRIRCTPKRGGVASGLAIGAAVCLLLGQITATAATKCTCCSSSLHRRGCKIAAIILLTLSWISFVIAELFLNTAASLSSYQVERFEESGCSTVLQGVSVVGAAFTLVTLLLSIAYLSVYMSGMKKPKKKTSTDETSRIVDMEVAKPV